MCGNGHVIGMTSQMCKCFSAQMLSGMKIVGVKSIIPISLSCALCGVFHAAAVGQGTDVGAPCAAPPCTIQDDPACPRTRAHVDVRLPFSPGTGWSCFDTQRQAMQETDAPRVSSETRAAPRSHTPRHQQRAVRDGHCMYQLSHLHTWPAWAAPCKLVCCRVRYCEGDFGVARVLAQRVTAGSAPHSSTPTYGLFDHLQHACAWHAVRVVPQHASDARAGAHACV